MATLYDLKPPEAPEVYKRYPDAQARAEAAAEVIKKALLAEGFGDVMTDLQVEAFDDGHGGGVRVSTTTPKFVGYGDT